MKRLSICDNDYRTQCIFSVKKMHRDDKKTILRQTIHRVTCDDSIVCNKK